MIFLEIFFPLIPTAKARSRQYRLKRPYFNRHGKLVEFGSYTPNKTANYEDDIRAIARRYMIENHLTIASGPIGAYIVFYFPRPKRHTRKQRASLFHIVKPDRDNCEKAILDPLNKIVFNDDAQVCDSSTSKRYCQETQQPGVLLRLEKLE